jgi:hypothetical protein
VVLKNVDKRERRRKKCGKNGGTKKQITRR